MKVATVINKQSYKEYNRKMNFAILQLVIGLFFFTSFIALDFNPLNWQISERYFFVLALLIGDVLITIIGYWVDSINER